MEEPKKDVPVENSSIWRQVARDTETFLDKKSPRPKKKLHEISLTLGTHVIDILESLADSFKSISKISEVILTTYHVKIGIGTPCLYLNDGQFALDGSPVIASTGARPVNKGSFSEAETHEGDFLEWGQSQDGEWAEKVAIVRDKRTGVVLEIPVKRIKFPPPKTRKHL